MRKQNLKKPATAADRRKTSLPEAPVKQKDVGRDDEGQSTVADAAESPRQAHELPQRSVPAEQDERPGPLGESLPAEVRHRQLEPAAASTPAGQAQQESEEPSAASGSVAARAADLPAQEPPAPLPAQQMEPAQATGQKPAPSSPEEPLAPHSALQELAAEPAVASGEARTDKKPDDVFEATRTASQPKKRERSQEASSKSATLQKKLDEAKATDARASKTAILQKKLDEARKSSTPKAAEEARTPKKTRDNDKTSKKNPVPTPSAKP